uniref:Cytochrome b n=1 Tax=Rhabdopleura compacta TaxID=638968 RepID=F8J479_RHACM|nr:cytochrome b [Rhabdopleura compacta]
MGFQDNSIVVTGFAKFISDVKCPVNLSYMWAFGSILGVGLALQIVSGILLAIYFVNSSESAHSSILHIEQDVCLGWLVRSVHINGASFLFICLYLHAGRGIYFSIYTGHPRAWMTGMIVLVLCWASAFFGYILPWGQMSFWGATVITNLFSTVPFFGGQIVELLWGGYVISGVTLKRFYVFHFLCPIIMGLMVIAHIWFIHQTGSSQPLGRESYVDVNFHPLYTYKDIIGFCIYVSLLLWVSLFCPDMFSDPVNLVPANPFKTPNHIVPEWYFLFFYGVLRSIPSKTWGAAAAGAVMSNLFYVGSKNTNLVHSCKLRASGKKYFGVGVAVVLVSYYGASPAGMPYEDILRVIVLIIVVTLKFHNNIGSVLDTKDGYKWRAKLTTLKHDPKNCWLSDSNNYIYESSDYGGNKVTYHIDNTGHIKKFHLINWWGHLSWW